MYVLQCLKFKQWLKTCHRIQFKFLLHVNKKPLYMFKMSLCKKKIKIIILLTLITCVLYTIIFNQSFTNKTMKHAQLTCFNLRIPLLCVSHLYNSPNPKSV